MTYESLRYERRDGLATITLSRDGRPNTLGRTAIAELADVAHRCAVDADVRAVLVTGEGKTFCVGGDLPSFAREHDLPLAMKQLTPHIHSTISRFVRMPKPVVTAINGVVGGGGMGLALAGDLCLASEDATFTMAYTASGLTPDAGTTWLLPRLIGMRRAAELTFLKRTLSAQEALEWGLVTRVVAPGSLAGEAEDVARSLAEGPTGAYGRVKALLRRSLSASLEEQLEDEAVAIAETMATADAQEGISAFRERRSPSFVGR